MPHSSLLVINADGPETRVALVQDGYLGELYIERKRERGIAGNIYKGRVERVLPGMQAAFVNIGLEKSAYLHVSDVRGTPDDLKRLLAGEASRAATDEDEDADDAARAGGGARIEDLLKEGQEVIVQVTKEPISTKGARTTRYISLPGRHLVFMPTVDHIGISRRIASDKERRRLRDIVESMRPAGSGFIVRTVAENVSERELKSDMEFLIKLWNEVVRRAAGGRCPSLIYNDLDLLLRTVRDLFTADVEKLIIDSRSEYDRTKKFIAAFMPDFAGHIELYDGNDPIFDGYGIEIEIDRALERKVWLKSGGYLIVDEMEALTAVDVNTGRFVGKKSLEDTITKTNMEAAQEVAEQLRIRSIGGMIVVDFIDMDRPHNREKVTRAFNEHLRKDRSKAAVTRISELGPHRDDAQADARIAAAHADRAVHGVRGQGLHEVAPHGDVRDPARAAPAGRSGRGRHGDGRGSSRRRAGSADDRPVVSRGDGEAAAEADHGQGARVVPRRGLRDPLAERQDADREVRGRRRRARRQGWSARRQAEEAPAPPHRAPRRGRGDARRGRGERGRPRIAGRRGGGGAQRRARARARGGGRGDGPDGQRPGRRRRRRCVRADAQSRRHAPAWRLGRHGRLTRQGGRRAVVRVCFVCLGNICRSPTAEAVMRHLVAQEGLGDRIKVDSAGTGDWHVGDPPDRRARAVGAARGIPLSGTARQFTAGDFSGYDHVIAMDRANRDELLRMAGTPADRGKVRLLRSFDASAPPDADVPDPYYGGPGGFDEVFDICERACRGLLDHLRRVHGA